MNGDLIIGLRLGAIGISVTFVALGLLSLIMFLMLRIFPVNRVPGGDIPSVDRSGAENPAETSLEETAIALAVGVCLLERSGALEYRDPSLGSLLEG